MEKFITLNDYQQIFNIIHSVYNGIENNREANCMFYNLAGSIILKKKYSIKADPIIGAACFRLIKYPDPLLVLGINNNGMLESTLDSFHCWIDVNQYVIDFTAPLFNEYVIKAKGQYIIPRKMFLKEKSKMSNKFIEVGDFIVKPNRQLTDIKIEEGLKNRSVSDLINICLDWYKKPPLNPINSYKISANSVIKNLVLQNIVLSGSW